MANATIQAPAGANASSFVKSMPFTAYGNSKGANGLRVDSNTIHNSDNPDRIGKIFNKVMLLKGQNVVAEIPVYSGIDNGEKITPQDVVAQMATLQVGEYADGSLLLCRQGSAERSEALSVAF